MTDPTINQPNKKSDLFKDMHDQMTPGPEVLKSLADKIELESSTGTKSGAKSRTHSRTRIMPMAIAAAAAVAVLAFGLAVTLPVLTKGPAAISATGGLTPSIAGQVNSPESYGELFASIKDHVVDTAVYDAMPLFSLSESSTAAPAAEMPSDSSASNKSDSPEFSQTNNQVTGVDEGDVVKTDGEHIYILHNNQVIIATANGEDSQEVTRFYPQENVEKSYYASVSATDLYIQNNILAVIYNYNDIIDGAKGYSLQNTNQSTRVALFDVSDVSTPKPLHVWGQSGALKQSRVYDGVLYLISNYSIYDYENLSESDPTTYVPLLYSGAEAERLLEPDEICILPDYTSAIYTIVSSLDLKSAQRIDSQSILGETDTVYMSTDNLYVVEQSQGYEQNVTERDLTSEYVETHSFTTSNISRFALDKGQISLAANASVSGSLLNQFSLDQHDGYLRVALTRNDFTSVYIQNKITGSRDYSNLDGFESSSGTSGSSNSSSNSAADTAAPSTSPSTTSSSNSAADTAAPSTSPSTTSINNGQTNALVVLNSNLEVVGSVEGLAADERIYSVRFDGPLGYMVTFKQVDPLFTIDLSDPTHPQVQSALKIPGFSQYLHPYTPGRLLGLGMQANETTGRTGNMKLSMFNTNDPFNVSEQAKLDLDVSSSTALTNHKAILIDSSHDLIGFEAVTYNRNTSSYSSYANYYYLVFGYSDLQGFYQRAVIELPVESNHLEANVRGLFVGDYFYISDGSNLGVFDLDTLKELTWIKLQVGEQTPTTTPTTPTTPKPLYLVE
ncbi:hypothetical protein FACS1894104_3730 [Actinomycetota bacterium]|nr:hypothetical protein FACS1894104_3730 [Actinomycetota bacterium]